LKYIKIEWPNSDDLQIVIASARRSFTKEFFMEVLIISCWHIWLRRNGQLLLVGVLISYMICPCLGIYMMKSKYHDDLMACIISIP
jgi:hypothetical protein